MRYVYRSDQFLTFLKLLTIQGGRREDKEQRSFKLLRLNKKYKEIVLEVFFGSKANMFKRNAHLLLNMVALPPKNISIIISLYFLFWQRGSALLRSLLSAILASKLSIF